jgi:hypothetical protein
LLAFGIGQIHFSHDLHLNTPGVPIQRCKALGVVPTGEAAPEVFSFAFGDLLHRENTDQLLYGLGTLLDTQVHWDVLEKRAGAEPDPSFLAADAQLSLCLA